MFFLSIAALIGAFVYLLPSYIARKRKHKDLTGIVVVNILFGWSLIGYLVALVWAFKEERESPQVIIQNGSSHPIASHGQQSLEAQLTELKSLRDKELLTEEEYKAKRSAILS